MTWIDYSMDSGDTVFLNKEEKRYTNLYKKMLMVVPIYQEAV